MRINRYIAYCSGLSRRAADRAIEQGRVLVNGSPIHMGVEIREADRVTLDGVALRTPEKRKLILFNKPEGYVSSREGQGSKTIYDLLPHELSELKSIGRLDKASSGLLLLTNDGQLTHQLTHPSKQKIKVYRVELSRPLQSDDKASIEKGIMLEDGKSSLALAGNGTAWTVSMHEGRNRQIRRTFAALGYVVTKLHRVQFGEYTLDPGLAPGAFREIQG